LTVTSPRLTLSLEALDGPSFMGLIFAAMADCPDGGEVRAIFPEEELAAIWSLDSFTPYRPPNLRPTGIERCIGIYANAEIWASPWAPSGIVTVEVIPPPAPMVMRG
jgi:hypothetical protein